MRIKIVTTFVFCLFLVSFNSYGDHHGNASDAELLEEMTVEHGRSANREEWENHYAMYAVGCTGFWEYGMKRTQMQTEQSLENRISNAKDWNERGGIRRIWNRHPEAVVHGDFAVATCYQHGWFQNTKGERTNVLNRVSLIWKRTDDGWKIVHEHYSEMKREN